MTDVTNASRTMMMDLATGKWSGENITKLGVEKYVGEGRGLPEVRTGENKREQRIEQERRGGIKEGGSKGEVARGIEERSRD